MAEGFSFLASPRVRAAARPRSQITVSEWADKYRDLDRIESPHRPGPWETDFVPYLRKPMDAFSHPEVERITFVAASRLGKSELLKNCFGYAVDQWPRNLMLVEPVERDAKEFSNDQLRPLFASCPRLAGQVPPREKGDRRAALTTIKYSLQDMTVYIAWATSPSTLSMRTIGVLLLDELRGFPPSSGGEGDPLDLAMKRTGTFGAGQYKIVAVSSPGTKGDALSRAYASSDRETYHVPCPHCGEFQRLVFREKAGDGWAYRVKVPEGERDAERIRNERLAWYECRRCAGRIEDRHRRDMVARGVWVPEGAHVETVTRGEGPADHRVAGPDSKDVPEWPRHVGFGGLSSLYSPWPRATFSETAARFFETDPGHGGALESFRVFVNTELADEWEDRTQETTPEGLRRNLEDYPQGEIPAWARVLTAFVDVQLDHFWIAIRAWGTNWRSRLVLAGRLEDWQAVEDAVAHTVYPRAPGEGEPLGVTLALMDARYRASDVKAFCRRLRNLFRPSMGYEHIPDASFRKGKPELTPGGVAIPGTSVWHLDTTDYKDVLKRFIEGLAGEPGEWRFGAWVPREYVEHMTAEHKVMHIDRKTGEASWHWTLREAGLSNHLWDCEVGCVAAADMAGVRALRDGGAPVVYKPRPADERPPVRPPFRRTY